MKDLLPISVVEGEGFRELMTSLKPEYIVAARSTFISKIERPYHESSGHLKIKLATADHVALTPNSWRALTRPI